MTERVPEDEPLMRDLVGAMLRRTRLEQGRTLREVAEASQVSLPYLSEIERGRKEPSSEVLAAIRQALGLRLVDLVGTMHMELASSPVVPAQGPGVGGGHQAVMLAA
ncbi:MULTISPECIES: helix-turn-helix domain-containing protein [Nocardiopsis]|uniref:helix-turn-helix domain-containing protein n=1 Tax=Nocardiopsis TaxID=2013 RepID=UPI00034DF2E1